MKNEFLGDVIIGLLEIILITPLRYQLSSHLNKFYGKWGGVDCQTLELDKQRKPIAWIFYREAELESEHVFYT